MRAPQARQRVLLSRPDGVTGAALLRALRRGDRRALARAITLVELSRPDHRDQAERLIEALLPETGKAVRIGISGPPGAGKSTFIERFGLARHRTRPTDRGAGRRSRLEARRRRDPRRQDAHGRAVARAGGVHPPVTARRQRWAASRAAPARRSCCAKPPGSTRYCRDDRRRPVETAVAEIVDMFVLILPPAAGDELQGMKRGIVELADLVLVNKADGELLATRNRSAADYANAMRLIRPRNPDWQVPVRAISALAGAGVRGVGTMSTVSRGARAERRVVAPPRRAGPRRAMVGDWRQPPRPVPRRSPSRPVPHRRRGGSHGRHAHPDRRGAGTTDVVYWRGLRKPGSSPTYRLDQTWPKCVKGLARGP